MKNNQPVTDQQRFINPKRPVVTKTDLQSRIKYANPAFIEISGFTRDELLGQPHNVVRHPHMPPAAFADLWHTLKSGRPWQGMVKNRCKDGGYYWVDAYVTPVTERGQTVGYMSVRSAPTTAQIQTAEALYRDVSAGKAPFPTTPPLPKMRFAWIMSAAATLPALSAWLLAFFGVSAWIVLPVLIAMILPLIFLTLRSVGQPLQQAEAAISHISEGNLQEKVQTKAAREFSTLLTTIESMRVNLRAIIADAVSAADDVGKQSADLSMQTDDLKSAAHQQADGVSVVASALEQLSASIGEISASTSKSATHADSARALSHKSVQQMDEVQQSSDRIGETVGAAQGTIRELQNAVMQIGAITQTIKEIADQTNLLALNAAIEAARAGEQGRGFAVVADEVRKLSERTASSTNTIASTIASVQEISSSALRSMQEAVQAVGDGKACIDTARDSMREIGIATDGVAEASHEVADALSQQSKASSEVAVSMEQMSSTTEQNGVSIGRVSESAAQLSEIANELHTLLSHFERSL